MKHPRLFYCNISFDAMMGGSLSDKLRPVCAEMSLFALYFQREADYAHLAVDIDDEYSEYLAQLGFYPRRAPSGIALNGCTGIAWGWNDESRTVMSRYGASYECPSNDIVMRANSRAVSSLISKKLSFPVQGIICTTEKEIIEYLSRETRRPLLVKPLFSSSGSGFVHIVTTTLTDSMLSRLSAHLPRGGVCIEPLLDRRDDYGVNFTVEKNGSCTLLGIHRALVSHTGRFNGIMLTDIDDQIRDELSSCAVKVSAELAALGYFGPAGIDAFTYYENGRCYLNPMCEINARMSMGFVARSCKEILGGRHVLLRHIRTKGSALPETYSDFVKSLGSHSYDKASQRGIALLSPLRLTDINDTRQPLFSLFYCAGDSPDELMRLNAVCEQVVDRK